MDIDDLIDDSITDRVVQVDNDDPDWVDLDVNESETNKTDGSGKTKIISFIPP